MTSRDFCFWLRGYIESTGDNALAGSDVKAIRKKLSEIVVYDTPASPFWPYGIATNAADTFYKQPTIAGTTVIG